MFINQQKLIENTISEEIEKHTKSQKFRNEIQDLVSSELRRYEYAWSIKYGDIFWREAATKAELKEIYKDLIKYIHTFLADSDSNFRYGMESIENHMKSWIHYEVSDELLKDIHALRREMEEKQIQLRQMKQSIDQILKGMRNTCID